jgi:transcriptional regulator of acetoin/glycerol metabolism
VVRVEHLPDSLGLGAARLTVATVPAATSPVLRRGEIDEAALRTLAETSNCTRKELAHLAGLSERTLYRRLKALGLL